MNIYIFSNIISNAPQSPSDHVRDCVYVCFSTGRNLQFSRWKKRKFDQDEEKEIQYDDYYDEIYNLGPASYIFTSKTYPRCLNQHHREPLNAVLFDFSNKCIRARYTMISVNYHQFMV